MCLITWSDWEWSCCGLPEAGDDGGSLVGLRLNDLAVHDFHHGTERRDYEIRHPLPAVTERAEAIPARLPGSDVGNYCRGNDHESDDPVLFSQSIARCPHWQNAVGIHGIGRRQQGCGGLWAGGHDFFYGFTAPFVLTGSYTNVMAYGLVSKSEPVSWLEWFLYALPGFVIFSAVMIAVLLRMFGRTTAPRPISPEVLDEQLRLLGPLSRVEGMTLAAVIGCIGLMILQPVHGVDSTWIMLGGFALLIISGVLDQRTLTSGIDWTFLLFLGVAFSFSAAVDQLGIATAMSGFLKEYIGWVAASPVLFLTAVVLISFIVTLVIRDDPAVILLLTALLPIGSELGIHPGCLYLLSCCRRTVLFHLSVANLFDGLLQLRGEGLHSPAGTAHRTCVWPGRPARYGMSVPYWKWLGLLD